MHVLSNFPRRGVPPDQSMEGDVYQIQKEDLSGPWEVQNVLEAATYENDRGEAVQGEFQAHTLQTLVADVPGVLQQVKIVCKSTHVDAVCCYNHAAGTPIGIILVFLTVSDIECCTFDCGSWC